MGCSADDAQCQDDEKPSHEVDITKGFWMGQTEVTPAMARLVAGVPPREFTGHVLDLPKKGAADVLSARD